MHPLKMNLLLGLLRRLFISRSLALLYFKIAPLKISLRMQTLFFILDQTGKTWVLHLMMSYLTISKTDRMEYLT